MAYGHFQRVNSFQKGRIGFRIHAQRHPPVLVAAAGVVGQRDFGSHIAAQVRKQAQLHQHLKTVADTKYEFTVGNELPDVIEQRAAVRAVLTVAQLVGQHHARAQIIAERKAAGEI